MRFYRPLGRISALTFDLDDTLYDNRPVILRTEREALTFVQNYHPALRSFQNEDLQRLRQAVREAEPEIYHDVTRWRFRSIEQAMLDAGLSAEEARAGAQNRSAICTFWLRKNSTCRSARSYMLGTISPLTWVGQFAAECRLVGSDRKMAI